MQTTDIVTYKPDVFRAISVEAYNFISDGNIGRVFKLLRRHNYLTISDIVREFEKEGDPKSESSIYRYLQRLVSVEIAVKAGKRIFLNQDITVRSEPLYCLTSRAFIQDVKSLMNKDLKRYKEIMTYSCKLLSRLHPDKDVSAAKVAELMVKNFTKYYNIVGELEVQPEEEDKEFLDGLEFEEIIFLHDTVLWFSLLLDENFMKEFFDAVKKK